MLDVKISKYLGILNPQKKKPHYMCDINLLTPATARDWSHGVFVKTPLYFFLDLGVFIHSRMLT